MSSMFAYICLGSNNLERSSRFYDATLGVLGYQRCDTSAENETSWTGWIGWGTYEKEGATQDALWICKPYNGAPATTSNGGMVALWARDWRSVDQFHATALAYGGTSEGAPGLRLLYNPDFYACYVRDPDGNKLAVVCRGFTSAQGQ
jgi:catechol 2,3-dioxygenase-like lactoylglutathione lyase family enzyme